MASQSALCQPDDEETREARDGYRYTRLQFEEYYGEMWYVHWKEARIVSAGRGPQLAAATAFNAGASQPGVAAGPDVPETSGRQPPEAEAMATIPVARSALQRQESINLELAIQPDNIWNCYPCIIGQACECLTCPYYHSDVEKRCKQFVQRLCKNVEGGGRCIGGLHVQWEDLYKTFKINLQASREAKNSLRKLKEVSANDRAKYYRIEVTGFAMVRARLLRSCLQLMPLLHELVLPECTSEKHLLVFLCDVVEPCGKTNPRLRIVRFQDGTQEPLW